MLARWFRTRFRRVPEQAVANACKMVPDMVPDQVPDKGVAMACNMVPDQVLERPE